MKRFEPDRYYKPRDLSSLATPGTLAVWRCRGMGPPFVKPTAQRILYRGSDLDDWLDRCRVEPTEAA